MDLDNPFCSKMVDYYTPLKERILKRYYFQKESFFSQNIEVTPEDWERYVRSDKVLRETERVIKTIIEKINEGKGLEAA